MTLQEIVTNIKNLKAGGKQSDDTQMSDAQYVFIIDYYRAILIRQQQAKGQSVNEQCLQRLNPDKVILSKSLVDSCELVTNEIPAFIEGHKANLATFVGTEGGASYQRTTMNKSMWDKHGAYSMQFKKWYEVGNKIVVKNHNKNQKLQIVGLFERPIEVVEFNGELDEMNPYSFTYPISNVLLDTLYKMIIDAELKVSLTLAQDNLNNGKEDIKSA